jgi:hypothetical protein
MMRWGTTHQFGQAVRHKIPRIAPEFRESPWQVMGLTLLLGKAIQRRMARSDILPH